MSARVERRWKVTREVHESREEEDWPADPRLSSLGHPLRGTHAAEACRAGRLSDLIGVRARITALTDSLSWAERPQKDGKWALDRRVPAWGT
jgi:hypothetical protein